jgi:hypothetical protein
VETGFITVFTEAHKSGPRLFVYFATSQVLQCGVVNTSPLPPSGGPRLFDSLLHLVQVEVKWMCYFSNMRETKFGFHFEEPRELITARVWGGGCKLHLISYAELCVCVCDVTDCVRTNKRRQIYDIAEGLEKGRGEIKWKHTENEGKERTAKYTQRKHSVHLSKARTRNVCNKFLLDQTAAYSWSPNFQAMKVLDLARLYRTLLSGEELSRKS